MSSMFHYNPRPWILDLRIDANLKVLTPEDLFKNLVSCNVERREANSTESAIHHLTAPIKPQAVLVRDPAITTEEHADVLDWVLAYARKGGRVIFCSGFYGNIGPDALDNFYKRLRLPWKMTCFDKVTVFTNPFFSHDRFISHDKFISHPRVINLRIKERIYDAAFFHESVDPADMVYVKAGFSEAPWTPVMFKPFTKGWLGFVGYPNPAKEPANVIFALCGIDKS